MTKRWRFLSCLLVVSAVLLATIRLGWKDQALGDNPGGDPRGPCPTFYCPTDLNNDGVVDGDDLALFPLSSCEDPAILCPPCCREDFDGDGEIACFDFFILLASFGDCDGCGPGAGDCFVANGTPGCDDGVCCVAVCDIDPICCTFEWDAMCAELAAIHCQDIREFLVAGEAEKIDVGDLDTGTPPLFGGASTTDVVVVIPDPDPMNAGSVQILLNQGTSGMRTWLGLVANAPVSVGREPSDLEVAFLDNDGHLDVAVTNAGDNTVSILINQGTGDAALVEVSTVAVGNAPSAIGAGTFTGDAFVDLLVANAGDNNVVLLTNDGSGGFSVGLGIPVGTEPRALAIDDLDDNKDLDVAGVSRLGPGGLTGGVWVLMGLGDGTFEAAVFYDIGAEPRDLAIGDVDQDGLPDIVAVNESDATISILINQGDGTFMAAPNVPVGGLPRAIEALDLDGDLDPDLVVVADDEVLGPAVQILENTGTVPGVVAFADPVGFGVRADPNDAAGVDLDNDGQVDLGTANTDDGPTGGSVTALLNAIVPCPSDANGDGSTNVLDLIDVLLCFGLPALPPCDTGQDVNQDGVINVLDLIELLLAFGQECP